MCNLVKSLQSLWHIICYVHSRMLINLTLSNIVLSNLILGGQNVRSEEYIEEDMEEAESLHVDNPNIEGDLVETKPGKHVRISE